MRSETREKSFDCVAFMCEARARIDEEIKGMSWPELRQWLDSQRPTDPHLAALWDRAKPPAGRKGARQELTDEAAPE